jgi:hypothetical protein
MRQDFHLMLVSQENTIFPPIKANSQDCGSYLGPLAFRTCCLSIRRYSGRQPDLVERCSGAQSNGQIFPLYIISLVNRKCVPNLSTWIQAAPLKPHETLSKKTSNVLQRPSVPKSESQISIITGLRYIIAHSNNCTSLGASLGYIKRKDSVADCQCR